MNFRQFNHPNEDALYQLADGQQGFFTAKQSIDCGFSSKNHAYYVKKGKWIKEGRGIYRLANYPQGERPDLILWYLWSRNLQDIPQGIYSHQTALDLYDLCDIMPSRLHMTVPKNFRRRIAIPKILKIYKRDILDIDIKYYLGVKVISPLRTLIDVIEEESLSHDLIQQAISNALNRGLIISRTDFIEHFYVKNSPSLIQKIEEYFK